MRLRNLAERSDAGSPTKIDFAHTQCLPSIAGTNRTNNELPEGGYWQPQRVSRFW
jgi:hypothetical protein